MSEQAMDLRSAAAALRRRARFIAIGGVLGLAAGVGYVLTQPPHLTSTALVVLPTPSSDQQSGPDVDTQVRIASSASILAKAGEAVSPSLSANAMEKRVQVSAATTQLVKITVWAPESRDAKALARAVTNAYVEYLQSAANAVQNSALAGLEARKAKLQDTIDALQTEMDATKQRRASEPADSAAGRKDAQLYTELLAEQAQSGLQLDRVKGQISTGGGGGTVSAASIAQVVQPATTPVPRLLLIPLSLWGPVGMVLGMALVSGLVLLLARRDRRLRLRDEIADAVGSTVLLSVRSRAPRSVAGWSLLLQSYAPGNVESWGYRQFLRTLAPADGRAPRPRARGGRVEHPESLTVITFAGDRQALAFGPQLASFTASLDIQTRLITAVGSKSAAELWSACSAERSGDVRRNLVVGEVRPAENAELAVILAVVDRDTPDFGYSLRADGIVLAVAAGTASEEDLARFAVAMDAAGGRLAGVVVVNPDASDRTTGRFTLEERGRQVALPVRLHGVGAEGVVESPARGRR